MQRKIFSVDRIPQVKNTLGKLAASLFLFIGTVSIQIIFTPSIVNAAQAISEEQREHDTRVGWVIMASFIVVPILWCLISTMFKAKEDREGMQRFQSLSPEQQMREINRLEREVAQEDRMAEQRRQHNQHRDHQEFLRNLEKERIARENKIRDFRIRHGREPNSWEI
jgi:hypothetical protein